MPPQLNVSRRNTCEAICRHPVVHNLAWRGARLMLASLAEVSPKPTGNLNVTPNVQALGLHTSLDNNLY